MTAHSNTGTVLDRILEARRAEVDHRKRVLPETALKYGVKAAPPGRDFAAALSRDALNVIAELKPASPSRGIIREPFDPPALAMRELMNDLRQDGTVTGGPRPMTPKDRSRFLSTLDQTIIAVRRSHPQSPP